MNSTSIVEPPTGRKGRLVGRLKPLIVAAGVAIGALCAVAAPADAAIWWNDLNGTVNGAGGAHYCYYDRMSGASSLQVEYAAGPDGKAQLPWGGWESYPYVIAVEAYLSTNGGAWVWIGHGEAQVSDTRFSTRVFYASGSWKRPTHATSSYRTKFKYTVVTFNGTVLTGWDYGSSYQYQGSPTWGRYVPVTTTTCQA
jgi:hypothetical protein